MGNLLTLQWNLDASPSSELSAGGAVFRFYKLVCVVWTRALSQLSVNFSSDHLAHNICVCGVAGF